MIIGITGTDGAGKGSVVDYLVEKHGFSHYSSRSLIMAETAKRGLEPTRENIRIVANSMRAEEGPDVIVRHALKQMEKDGVKKAVIESVRAVKEVDTLRRVGGILLAIDAPVEERYRRIVERGSTTDKISFEDFVKQEELEMEDPDPNGMQKRKVMEMAEHTISNCDSLDNLYEAVNDFVKRYS